MSPTPHVRPSIRPWPRVVPTVALIVLLIAPASAQEPAAAAQHRHDEPGLFASRETSGTAWVPDETPMYGLERDWRRWSVMFHGVAFGQFLYEPGEIHRTGGFSEHQFSSVNWAMLMARRPLGSARVGFRGMLSIEPWTVGSCGALNLLATGEMCEGDTIHDRQHPHDLFMELAAEYDRPLRGSRRLQLYGALSGEPALGPPGFPHRLSAMPNPIAPIAHHWLDATHIAFGVLTAGVYDTRWKAEASAFNGREPDDDRADLDLGPLDSFSGRLWFLPTRRLAFQVSAAHLNEAEAEFPPDPRSDVDRFTASATYHRTFANGNTWATTMAMGINSAREIIPGGAFDATTFAGLIETSVNLGSRNGWFGRAELVEKPAHDLHAHEFPTTIFTLAKLQAGYVRYFPGRSYAVPGIGGTVSASIVPPELESRYGGRVAPGFGVFVILRPPAHDMPGR